MKSIQGNIMSMEFSLKPFDPGQTFCCGQCFRWERLPDGSWEGVALGRVVSLEFSRGEITLSGVPAEEEQRWSQYFDAGTDYEKIREELSEKDSVIKAALETGSGIRILRQELWETIISFIISQNNNIPRIRGCIERLSEGFGEPCGEDHSGRIRCSLPAPEVLAALEPEDLAGVRLGYRAGYLIRCAREVTERGLPRSRDELLALTGVGPKVADCIALFGLHDRSRFPVDVWVKRVMNRLYGLPEDDVSGIRSFAEERFGDLGGYAQQYLFYYVRETAAK